jgi:hypothetical protein
MLLGIGALYGKDSEEYVMAGGARKREVSRSISKSRVGVMKKKPLAEEETAA